MNGDGARLAFLLLAVVLPVSALLARRVPLGMSIRMALVWVAIFAVGFLLVGLLTPRQRPRAEERPPTHEAALLQQNFT